MKHPLASADAGPEVVESVPPNLLAGMAMAEMLAAMAMATRGRPIVIVGLATIDTLLEAATTAAAAMAVVTTAEEAAIVAAAVAATATAAAVAAVAAAVMTTSRQ